MRWFVGVSLMHQKYHYWRCILHSLGQNESLLFTILLCCVLCLYLFYRLALTKLYSLLVTKGPVITV